MVTDCQYGGRTTYNVRYKSDDDIVDRLNSLPITRCNKLSCVTHFDFTNCLSLHSAHLEQLAIVCPNLQRLNLQHSFHCLNSLKGLQAIASHCHSLQGLNSLGIHVSNVKDHNSLVGNFECYIVDSFSSGLLCFDVRSCKQEDFDKLVPKVFNHKGNTTWLFLW